MRGEAMPQRVRMNRFLETCPLRRLLASMPNGFGIDGAIPAMVVGAWKEPNTQLFAQPSPVFPEFREQLGAEHHVAILASLTAADVNHHSLAIDVGDFQVRQFGTAHSRGVEQHQHGSVERSARGVNEPFHFLLTENRW